MEQLRIEKKTLFFAKCSGDRFIIMLLWKVLGQRTGFCDDR